jgi:hypothetical protein
MKLGACTAVLVAALTGCAAVPTVTRDLPPAFLMEDCPEPEATVSTNAELAAWILSLRHSLRKCNNDKAALRDWAEQE